MGRNTRKYKDGGKRGLELSIKDTAEGTRATHSEIGYEAVRRISPAVTKQIMDGGPMKGKDFNVFVAQINDTFLKNDKDLAERITDVFGGSSGKFLKFSYGRNAFGTDEQAMDEIEKFVNGIPGMPFKIDRSELKFVGQDSHGKDTVVYDLRGMDSEDDVAAAMSNLDEKVQKALEGVFGENEGLRQLGLEAGIVNGELVIKLDHGKIDAESATAGVANLANEINDKTRKGLGQKRFTGSSVQSLGQDGGKDVFSIKLNVT